MSPLGGRLGALLVAVCAACSAPPRQAPEPVDAGASAALTEALALLRGSNRRDADVARQAAERAARLAPDWAAPRRLLDDRLRADLLGIEALGAHRTALERDPDDPVELYLAGRLEGESGRDRFQRALDIDPSFAWAHHGLAIEASARGRLAEAVARERAALARARDPWERSYFTSGLAQFLQAGGDHREALRVVEERLAQDEVAPADRSGLEVQAVLIGLDARDRDVRTRSYGRGLRLLREGDLADVDVERLVARMRQVGSTEDVEALALLAALATHGGPARDRLRAELMLETGTTPLALGLLERSLATGGHAPREGPLLRAARFGAAQFEAAVETWLAELPAVLLGEDGLPRDPRLAAVVRCERSRRADPERAPERLAELGDALIEAGWFREARSVAAWLAADDLDRALGIETRGLAGVELLESLQRLVYGGEPEPIDLGEGSLLGADAGRRGAAARAERARTGIRDIDGLLAAMAPVFARAHALLGGETDVRSVGQSLARSPRLAFGPIGSLVHPGPRFSALDEAHGLGVAGEPVPGLAAEMDRISRFALIGQMLGSDGPDAVVLARLDAVECRGEHLGVPWSGLVAWCEGADVRERAGRLGMRVAGAALHEGFWLDIEVVREERDHWERLRQGFLGGAESAERIARALATRGLAVDAGASPERLRSQRSAIGAVLEEADRVRLAVLADRADAASGEALGHLSLDELVRATAAHEEGHLTDRTRFLPIGDHLGDVARLVLEGHFSPQKIYELLEYRAQLVALCVAADPRVALAHVLDAAELDRTSSGAHARAYQDLLRDLVGILDREIAAEPGAWAEIDPARTLVHQLHRLAPERLRELAVALARRWGMVESPGA